MKHWLSIVVIGWVSLGLSGCTSNPSTAEVSLPKEEAAFTWWGDQTRAFGSYNYADSEETIKTELTDKFGLSVLPSFDALRASIEEEFAREGVESELGELQLSTTDKQLKLSVTDTFSNSEGTYVAYGTVTAVYQYLPELKKVKLSGQKIDIFNWTGEKSYQGKEFLTLIRQLGEILQIQDLDQRMREFEATVKTPEEMANQSVTLYADYLKGKEAKTFGKGLIVEFDSTGYPYKISGATYDYRV
ncbi:hypothetical protein LI951_10575 [Enterococcus sp. BWT-B8]|uniref:hypothetical protein n=1 Tax=Enterococcus sp. BWT-B8 TaxID=2885157 RepID=UPI001E583ED4|nr:hypothetical protein [Enterococcus sp. BWT-B8]MCB5952510.1 hypothetical protein [Enterococcus sp. BWT-B8]